MGSDPLGTYPMTGSSPWPAWLPNLLAFQVGWWGVVLSAAHGHPGWGLALVAALLGGHLRWVRPRRSEVLLIALVSLIGFALEGLILASGWVGYGLGGSSSDLAPLWMVALWANFATTLNVSLRFLRGHPWLAAALGGLGGPLAYWGGAGLGAMSFPDLGTGLAALALVWALVTPLLVALAARLEQGVRR